MNRTRVGLAPAHHVQCHVLSCSRSHARASSGVSRSPSRCSAFSTVSALPPFDCRGDACVALAGAGRRGAPFGRRMRRPYTNLCATAGAGFLTVASSQEKPLRDAGPLSSCGVAGRAMRVWWIRTASTPPIRLLRDLHRVAHPQMPVSDPGPHTLTARTRQLSETDGAPSRPPGNWDRGKTAPMCQAG